ncbi:hypothetical protein KSP39_PZI023794 [Platanthera zijinensis]|uniref:FRIGIDA-like protein n=1 Tax=Platanthera zijinensis TaxID=2320716 RepID=A0AAP0ATN0_9ASPA
MRGIDAGKKRRRLPVANGAVAGDLACVDDGGPCIIKALIRDEMYVEAADLSCGFGLTDTFPPLPLLSSAALKAIEVSKVERQEWMDSPHLIKESDMRQLNILKSVAKCIEDYKLGTQILGSINIYKKIMQLEIYLKKDGWTPRVPTLKRKAEHLEPYSLPERRSKEPFLSSSETPEEENEHRYPRQSQLPGSKLDNSNLPRGLGRRNYENSAGYRSLGVEYSSAQNVYQPQAPAYGNEGGRERQDLYKFADTVIEHEAKRGKSNRSNNPSSGASMFGRR